jgi:hypothetical protein
VAERRKAVLIGAVLEEQVACVFVDLLVFRGQSDVPLQIQKGFIRITLNLQALGSLQIRLGIFLV